jgi:hypothetical protein
MTKDAYEKWDSDDHNVYDGIQDSKKNICGFAEHGRQ